MITNVGTIDRVIRIVTALVGFCPLYTVLGVSTCLAREA